MMMDILFRHEQKKERKNGQNEECTITLYDFPDSFTLETEYKFTYQKYTAVGERPTRFVEITYRLTVDKNNSDFTVVSHLNTMGIGVVDSQVKPKKSKNNFERLNEFTNHGLYSGGKKNGSTKWGVKYDRKVLEVVDLIIKDLKPRIKNDYLKTKDYTNVSVDMLYDFIVDYFTDKKKIKGHDLIYTHIQEGVPKSKFLKENDGKFIPAILDQYGIKTKNFVTVLNEQTNQLIKIKSLRYLCGLFGDNYIDYMNRIDWEQHCYKSPYGHRLHRLKSEREKKCVVELFKNWGELDPLHTSLETFRDNDNIVHAIYKTLDLRDRLEKKFIDLKFSATDDESFKTLYEEWDGLKKYFSRGYKLRFIFPENFKTHVELPIMIGNVEYTPTILKTEEDFKVEGVIMKNCMANQFSHGMASIYITLRKGKRWVNIQYRKGEKLMCYGKANSPVPEDFKTAIDVLSKRMKNFSEVVWEKEKYDIL